MVIFEIAEIQFSEPLKEEFWRSVELVVGIDL
jgi:hypothetical protein